MDAAAAPGIFLVGMMGAGKTTVGRLLARRLGRRFVDSDVEIESRCGVRIPLIFEIEGSSNPIRIVMITIETMRSMIVNARRAVARWVAAAERTEAPLARPPCPWPRTAPSMPV